MVFGRAKFWVFYCIPLILAVLLAWQLGLYHQYKISSLNVYTRNAFSRLTATKGVSKMVTNGHSSHFRRVQKVKSDFAPCTISLYESNRTGMRVAVADQKGPKVVGHFALATEIHDDSGAPHTLEHLIFMGSKSYRYKGLLDQLATRSYSTTNAWTDTDHTAYTLDTAGWEAFSQMLPVYLEHVLLPTLTDAGCYTEVHHIDGTGQDAGVVYSEMQGTQNTEGELMSLKAKRMIYPENSGFRYETGGLMEALRVLKADRIRAFHHEMYQPKNLCLIICGEVDHNNLLEVLDTFEETILDDVPRLDEPFQRPWVKHGRTPKIRESTQEVVEFPEEDESMGELLIGFIGPPYENKSLSAALYTLLLYICGSSVALLDHTIVETEQLASAVYFSTDWRPDIIVWFSLSGVETAKLEAVNQRFFEVLNDAASKPFDMVYMKNCLERRIRDMKSGAEQSTSYFSNSLINDHLFGDRNGEDISQISSLKEYEKLRSWTETDWKSFYSNLFVDANHITILGKPSKAMADKLEKDETARVKSQQQRLGEQGLKDLERKLEAAKAENDKEIPKELLQKFTTPSTESIHFIPTMTARSGFAKEMGKLQNEIQQRIDQDKTSFPLFMHFEHVPSNFTRISIILNTHSIPTELRPLLTLYIDNFFQTPVNRTGQRVEFEQVVMQLEHDAVDYSLASGASLGNNETLRFQLDVEPKNYLIGIEWIRDLLFNSIFDETRLKSTLAKILADIPEEKRSGFGMATSVVGMLQSSRFSSSRAQNTLVKALYLRQILRLLKDSPAEVIEKLETLRGYITDPSNFRIFITGNLDSETLKTPVSTWEQLIEGIDTSKLELKPLDTRKDALSEAAKHPGNLAYIIPMSTLDSSFAYLTTKGIDSFEDPRLPAITVAIAYLEAVEGPMWVAVRGTGLAYGTFFERDLNSGLLRYVIYRSPDAHKAFAASKQTVENIATGKVELDELALEGAVSSIVYSFASEQPTMQTAAEVSFRNVVMRGIPKDFDKGFMKKVRAVQIADVKQIMKDMIMPLFEGESADLVVTCATIMQDKLVEKFKEEGFKPEVQSLSYFQDSYGLGGDEAADDDTDEEDEEEEDYEDGEEENSSDEKDN